MSSTSKASFSFKKILSYLGPGLIMAGAAIGVSHLVQATRAGAEFGFALLWAVVCANLLKYPFLEIGARFAAATNKNLLDGYKDIGKWAVWTFSLFTLSTMFIIEAAVCMVCAALATQLFNSPLSITHWAIIIYGICVLLLLIGRYGALRKLISVMMVTLFISSVAAFVSVLIKGPVNPNLIQNTPLFEIGSLSFLLALMGWMPIPIDSAVWQSIWTVEHHTTAKKEASLNHALWDFNIGYGMAAILSVLFLFLGVYLMFGSGETFADSGAVFASQLIQLYTEALGSWSYWIIAIAAFTAMFSTTLTVTDAFPRVIRAAVESWGHQKISSTLHHKIYNISVIGVVIGGLIIIVWLTASFKHLIDLATILSFLTAPILAYMNYKVMQLDYIPQEARLPKWHRFLSILGMIFLSVFAVIYMIWRFIL